MEIRCIDEFLYIAETLSFRKTANHFYVSRSVISRHISALEDAVGVRLLDRDSHAVRLTKAGEVFYREAQTIARDWSVALERTRQAGVGDYTLVRVGYLRNAARPVLAHFVRAMQAFHPDVKLSLVCMDHNDLVAAIAERTVDIALAVNIDAKLSRNYRFTPIYHDHFTIVCAKDHPLASKTDGVGLGDLYDQTVLLPDSYVYGRTSDHIRDLVSEETMHVSRSSYSDADMLTLKVETEGVLAFSSTMNNEIFRGRLAVLPLFDMDTAFCVSAFYHDDFEGAGFDACREVFEWCHDNMCDWYPNLAFSDCDE